MRILCANFKGGTGKSTVVFNLGMWRLMRGQKVVICDLDPQRTVSDVAAIREEDELDPVLPVTHELPARKAANTEYLIDVGLSDMASMADAIRAADKIVVPVSPSQADIWATQRFLEIVRQERGDAKMPPVLGFLNRADPHPRSRENSEAMVALKVLPGITALRPKLVQRLAFRRSFSEGLSVEELEPRGKAAAELNALARAIYKD